MKAVTFYNNELIKNYIGKFEDLSSNEVARMRIHLKNGYALSIIRSFGKYGADEGLFEIAPLSKTGNLDGELLNFECDDVKGHLTKEQVFEYLIQLAKK